MKPLNPLIQRITLPLLSLGMLLLSFATAKAEENSNQYYLIKVHADWCGLCKALEPGYQALKTEFEASSDSLRFLTFDRTDRLSKKTSEETAQSLGLGKLFKKSRKTGILLLVDGSSGSTLQTFAYDAEVAEMKQTIQDLLQKKT